MNSSDRTRGDPLGAPPEASSLAVPPPPPLAAADNYGSWLDRMQHTRTRHAAITKNLQSWANYKSWADQVKGSWEQGPEPKKK